MYGDFSVGTANARYRVKNIKGIINGKVRIASWNTGMEDVQNQLFYDDNGDGIGHVKSTNCSSGEDTVDLYVDGESEPWGEVVECKNGPKNVNGSTSQVVKLTSGAGNVHFIVEERGTYPTSLC